MQMIHHIPMLQLHAPLLWLPHLPSVRLSHRSTLWPPAWIKMGKLTTRIPKHITTRISPRYTSKTGGATTHSPYESHSADNSRIVDRKTRHRYDNMTCRLQFFSLMICVIWSCLPLDTVIMNDVFMIWSWNVLEKFRKLIGWLTTVDISLVVN